jgi:hypothetical protein
MSRELIAQLTDSSNLSDLIFGKSDPILRLSLLFSLLAGNLPRADGFAGTACSATNLVSETTKKLDLRRAGFAFAF